MSQRYAMAYRAGSGPEGETCGSCKNKKRFEAGSSRGWKCGLVKPRGSSSASDIRLKWAACVMWKAEEK